jgi:hypothetical protein
MIKSWE